ncbi:MAG: hypothetical protein L3J42_00145 [Hydrogenimonas sp.]|nr:hypothetical protein [Hydrogenimonas sp.]
MAALSGVSLDAAFVFLSVGPATNTVTIGVVKRMLGTKSLVIYLATIVGGSIFFGILLDLFFESMQIDPHSVVHMQEDSNWVSTLSFMILWGLVIWFFSKSLILKKSGCYSKGDSCCAKDS